MSDKDLNRKARKEKSFKFRVHGGSFCGDQDGLLTFRKP
jgi:hypothetical protein